mgnify:CR=1 FL=1
MVENPKAFEAYPPDRFIEIVKAWAALSWPITPEQAQHTYESLSYRSSPSDASLFISEFASDGEPDSYYTSADNHVDSIRLAIARRCPYEEESKHSSLVSETYAAYCAAFERTFSNITNHSQTNRADEWTIRSDEWTLDNDVRIGIGNIGVTIAFFIRSPYMTQLLREEREMGLTSYDDILEDD